MLAFSPRDRRFGVSDNPAGSSPDFDHVLSLLLDALGL
jgi:hypothetical protein